MTSSQLLCHFLRQKKERLQTGQTLLGKVILAWVIVQTLHNELW